MKALFARIWTTLKGWKTMLVSLLIAVIGVLQATDWATIVRPDEVGPVMLGVGILVAVLRVVTTTPIGRKE